MSVSMENKEALEQELVPSAEPAEKAADAVAEEIARASGRERVYVPA